MSKNKFSISKQQGLTIIELIIAISIAFIVIGFALSKVPQLMGALRSNGESSELQGIVTTAQKVAVTHNNWTTITLDVLARNDTFPQNRVTIPGTGSATATNRWGGTITFASGTIATAGDIGRFMYMSVPDYDCKNVVNNNASSFRRVYVDKNNSGTAGAGTIVKSDNAQLDLDALGKACAGGVNSITYDVAK